MNNNKSTNDDLTRIEKIAAACHQYMDQHYSQSRCLDASCLLRDLLLNYGFQVELFPGSAVYASKGCAQAARGEKPTAPQNYIVITANDKSMVAGTVRGDVKPGKELFGHVSVIVTKPSWNFAVLIDPTAYQFAREVSEGMASIQPEKILFLKIEKSKFKLTRNYNRLPVALANKKKDRPLISTDTRCGGEAQYEYSQLESPYWTNTLRDRNDEVAIIEQQLQEAC